MTLDIGKLVVAISDKFKLEEGTLYVPAGCTLDEIAEFLDKEVNNDS